MPEEPGDAEIRQLDAPVGGQQQVARLDVAVNDAAIVGMAQRAAGFDADPRHFPPVERTAAAKLLFQAVAVDQLHRVEQLAFLLAEAEQADDVGVAQLAERFDLGLEAGAEPLFSGQRGREQLDGGRLAGLAVDRLIDRAHAAPAELADDLIRSEPLDFHKNKSNACASRRPADARKKEKFDFCGLRRPAFLETAVPSSAETCNTLAP